MWRTRRHDHRRGRRAPSRKPSPRPAITASIPLALQAVQCSPTKRTRTPASSAISMTSASVARYCVLKCPYDVPEIFKEQRHRAQMRHVPQPARGRRSPRLRPGLPARSHPHRHRQHERDPQLPHCTPGARMIPAHFRRPTPCPPPNTFRQRVRSLASAPRAPNLCGSKIPTGRLSGCSSSRN